MHEGNGRMGALQHNFMVHCWLQREGCQPHQHTAAGEKLIKWLTRMKEHMAATAVGICERLTPYHYRYSSETYFCLLTGQDCGTTKIASRDRVAVSLKGTGVDVFVEQKPCRQMTMKQKENEARMRVLRIKGAEVVVSEDPSGFVHLTVVSLRKGKFVGVTTLHDYLFESHRAPVPAPVPALTAEEEDFEKKVDMARLVRTKRQRTTLC